MFKKIIEKTRERLKKITLISLIKTRLMGYILNTLGTIVAIIFLLTIYKQFFYLIFAIIFTIIINISAYIQEYQQYLQMKDLEKLKASFLEESKDNQQGYIG